MQRAQHRNAGDPMTKRGIIEELLARHPKYSHRQSETIVNAMFEEMASVLAHGERIEIRGFGSFGVKERRARQGRNPKTGETVAVAAKRIPFFRAGKEIRAESSPPGGPRLWAPWRSAYLTSTGQPTGQCIFCFGRLDARSRRRRLVL